MEIVKRVLFVLSIIIFCSNQLHAQNSLLDNEDLSQVNIDDYSDSQIMAFYNKEIESGIGESQFLKIAEERGMPDSQIIKLQQRLQLINSGKKISKTDDQYVEKVPIEPHPYDTIGINRNIQKFKNDNSIFGSELFTSNSL